MRSRTAENVGEGFTSRAVRQDNWDRYIVHFFRDAVLIGCIRIVKSIIPLDRNILNVIRAIIDDRNPNPYTILCDCGVSGKGDMVMRDGNVLACAL